MLAQKVYGHLCCEEIVEKKSLKTFFFSKLKSYMEGKAQTK